MGISLKLFSKGRKIWQVSWSLFYRTSITEKRFFDALFVPAFRQRLWDPCCRRLLQVVMNGALTDRTSTGNRPLPQPQLKAEA
jgi:hypothetical protein